MRSAAMRRRACWGVGASLRREGEAMLRSGIAGRGALVAVVLALLAPATAPAAGKPVVTTGAAADVGQQTVTLTGTVDPNGAPTTYYFQYGPTRVYGAATVATPV